MAHGWRVDSLRHHGRAEVTARHPDGATPAPALPAFPIIVGSPRSGTTLLRAMLDSHPDMAIIDESGIVVATIRFPFRAAHGFDAGAYVDYLLGHFRFPKLGIPEAELRACLADPLPQTTPTPSGASSRYTPA